MIEYKDSSIADILPQCLKHDPNIIAIGYAINQQVRKLLDMARMTGLYAVVDELPEQILDLMAIEMRSPYYKENLPIEKKRDIIKNTLLWHYHAGTLSAVRELVEYIWGQQSDIKEWFEYDGDPYTFQVDILDLESELSEKVLEDFIFSLQKVKNTRSWLTKIIFHRRKNKTVHIGSSACDYKRECIVDFYEAKNEMESAVYAGTQESNYGKAVIVE